MTIDYKKLLLTMIISDLEANKSSAEELFYKIPTIEEKIELITELCKMDTFKRLSFYVPDWLFSNDFGCHQKIEFRDEKEIQLFIDFVENLFGEDDGYPKKHIYGAALHSIKKVDLFKFFIDKVTMSYFLGLVQNETLDREIIGKECIDFFQKDLVSEDGCLTLGNKEDKVSYAVILIENEKFTTAKKTIKQLGLKVNDFVDYLKEDSDFALKCLNVFTSKDDCNKIINYYVESMELNKKMNKKVFLSMFKQIMGSYIGEKENKDKEKQVVIDICEHLIKDNDKNKILKLLEQIKPEFVGKASSYLESITSHFSFKELDNSLKTSTSKIRLKM